MPHPCTQTAVPFVGKDVPSRASEFAHPDVSQEELRVTTASHIRPFIHPLYTSIAVYAPMYTHYTCIYTIYTPNTPLNTPYTRPIYALKYPFKTGVNRFNGPVLSLRGPEGGRYAEARERPKAEDGGSDGPRDTSSILCDIPEMG